ncbi:hypothetical protein DWX17_21585 [[Clostridium] innocuum]|jgi:hypothetical protein|uniref:hypothetical protein n=1 Tax=Clostridium innocuum TaxID=1522 RepID=UPI000E710895|nr:hypothetical protein [[Clostridium] innocuum]RGT61655.1 hypothetical protein DWX17_21585 [[Clostridium] innocuum]RJV84186.1 hypothetical protein DWX45_18980 [Erysipelotrichaceae bacterium AF19-24AC]
MQDMLCTRYTGMNPLMLRKERSGEVFKLVKRILDSIEVNEEEIQNNNNRVIRRKATDDSWY